MVKDNTKGGEKKMEQVFVKVERFAETCPYCKKKLNPANSKRTAEANLKQHLTFCDKAPSNKSK